MVDKITYEFENIPYDVLSKLNKILTREKTDIKDSQSTVDVKTSDSGLDLA